MTAIARATRATSSFLDTAPAAYVLLVIAMLAWSGNAVVGRAFAGVVPPFSLSWVRWTVALAAALPFTWREVWASRQVIRREWRIILVLSLLGITLSNLLSYIGLQYTTVINSGLINSIGPVLILIATVAFFGERVTWRQIAGIVCSLAGVLAVVMRGDPRALLDLAVNGGDLLLLGAVVVWSGYSLVIRYRPKDLSPMALLTVCFLVGSVVLLPCQLFESMRQPVLLAAPTTLAAFLYIGVFPGLVSILCWNRAVAQIGANRASVFTHLMPFFSALLAVLFLGEKLQLFHLVGALFIFAGIGLAARGPAGSGREV
jgi:drug/metabolite transporter (DMT)-like permease